MTEILFIKSPLNLISKVSEIELNYLPNYGGYCRQGIASPSLIVNKLVILFPNINSS